jgi:hypothetical protein
VVWRQDHEHDHDNQNKAAKRRSATAAGRSSILIRKTGARCLAERQVCLDSSHVGIVHARSFAQPTFALCIFGGQQMASRRVRSQHFATRGDFKTFCDSLTCFASRNWLWHKAAKIIRYDVLTTAFYLEPPLLALAAELNVGR